MNNKRAFEMEFHWIFILIAGAVILGFFFMMAQKQKTASQERLATNLLTELNSAFVAALQSKGTAQLLNLPTSGIELSCGKTDICDCKYTILGRDKTTGDNIIFGPQKLTDAKATLWTLDWKAPYRATNFLYLTTQQVKYVIVSSDEPIIKQFETKILRDLPTTLKIQTVTNIQEINFGTEHTRVTYLTNPDIQQLTNKAKGKDVSTVYIQPPNNVTFYTRKNNNEAFTPITLPFLSDPQAEQAINDATLYAAIFSNNPHLYKCQMQTAYKKLANVASVIIARAQELQTETDAQGKTQCTYPIDTLQKLKTEAQKAAQGQDTSNTIIQYSQELHNANKVLLTSNCPVLY
ncbi:hypothetical protein HY485_01940 [Candidatus Woesearchaeota archaeon]|nr:hypothetical protein [Candidatus Woesearchaeota archaeon]